MSVLQLLKRTISIGYILYLTIDFLHFIFIRLYWKEIDGVIFEYHYESFLVSIVKWIFCVVMLILILDLGKVKGSWEHFTVCLISGIIIGVSIFFDSVKGSILTSIHFLDILSFLAIIYWFKKIDISFSLRLLHYIFAFLVVYLVPYIPSYLWSYFYI